MCGTWGTVEGKTKVPVWLAFQKEFRELRDDDTQLQATNATYVGGMSLIFPTKQEGDIRADGTYTGRKRPDLALSCA